MPLEPADVFERFAIMTTDGGKTDLEAMRILLNRWPLCRDALQAWHIAMGKVDSLDDDAAALYWAARESALMVERL